MKKISYALAFFALFSSCSDLETLEPFQNDTFIKYYGDKGNTEAVDLEIVVDGYAILAVNEDGGTTYSILFTTDHQGNNVIAPVRNNQDTVWTNFRASDLHAVDDGYLVIGDRINRDNNPTLMRLVKTDKAGNILKTIDVGDALVPYHGTAVTFSARDEVVVQGYIESATGDAVFTRGYDADLNNLLWSTVETPGNNTKYVTSASIFQNDQNGDAFVYLQLKDPTSLDPTLEHATSERNGVILGATPLYESSNLSGTQGDFSKTIELGVYASAFTVTEGTSTFIGLSSFNASGGNSQEAIRIKPNNELNYTAQSIHGVVNKDELVILGSVGESTVDTDFFITRVERLDGSVNPDTGFEKRIGGVGKETGAAIKQAADGGFVFVGTLDNTNENKVVVLVKVNSKGELIN